MKKSFVYKGRKVAYSDNENFYATAAIVLIHGNSLSSATFSNQLGSPKLNDFRIIIPDLPGHGESEPAKVPGAYSIPFYCNCIEALLRHLEVGKCILAGHSLGGHIALECLPVIPEKVTGICIWGAPPISKPPKMGDAYNMDHPVMVHLYSEHITNEQLKVLADGFTTASDHRQEIINSIKNTDSAARKYVGESVAAGLYEDEINILNTTEVPVAVIQGKKEPLVRAEYLENLKALIWKKQVHYLKQAGHSPQLSVPEEFNDLLYAFTSDCFGEKNN